MLRGVPDEYANGLGALVERRLTELVAADRRADDGPAPDRSGRTRAAPAADRDALAALVADRIWSASREGGMPG